MSDEIEADDGEKWNVGERILGALVGPIGGLLLGGKLPTPFSGADPKWKRKPTKGAAPAAKSAVPGMAKGGKLKKGKRMAHGGSVRGDGCAKRGHTKGKMR